MITICILYIIISKVKSVEMKYIYIYIAEPQYKCRLWK